MKFGRMSLEARIRKERPRHCHEWFSWYLDAQRLYYLCMDIDEDGSASEDERGEPSSIEPQLRTLARDKYLVTLDVLVGALCRDIRGPPDGCRWLENALKPNVNLCDVTMRTPLFKQKS